MLEWLGRLRVASARELRLFACACCRRIWHLLVEERSRRAVEAAESFADRLGRRDQLVAAEEAAFDATAERTILRSRARLAAAQAACIAAAHNAAYAAQHASDEVGWAVAAQTARQRARAGLPEAEAPTNWEERKGHCDLLRDLFGPLPFRPVAFDPTWRAAPVLGLAQRVYEERQLPSGTLDAALLRVLADALEEAGCDNEEVLGHLRSPGPHVRGCFAVDAVLSKQ
jgi:hypothetical protein